MTALLRPDPPPSNLVRAAQARLLAQLGHHGLERDIEATAPIAADQRLAPQSATPWPGPRRAPAEPTDDERYEFGEPFASGGLGLIRKARDLRLGRTIAVKELLRSDPAAERRFALEAAITARLQHPGIVPLYDIGRYPTGEPYYCMKLVEGRSLEHTIRACTDLRARLGLLEHLIAAADAIAYAHRHGVIHRDIKPANILIGELGETVVIDWGLAKDLGGAVIEAVPDLPPSIPGLDSTMTQHGTVLGTLRYMPPEQARGGHVDARSDVYSLGAVLHHILAGAPPHAEAADHELAARVSQGAVLDLHALVPDAPRELLAIARRAMDPDPERRYASAEALVDDLRRFRTGRLVDAHRYAPGEVLRLWLRRHRPAVMVASAATLTLFVAGGFAIENIRQQRDAATAAQAEAETAHAAADEALGAARERANAALLAQAHGALDHDPGQALLALAQVDLSEETALRRTRLLAQAAESRGAPGHTMRGHTRPISHMLALSTGALVNLDVGGAVWRWDPQTRTGQQVLDLAEPLAELIAARDTPAFAAIGARQAHVVDAGGQVHVIDLTGVPRGTDDTRHYAYQLSADGHVLAALTQPMTDSEFPGGAAAYRWDLRNAPITADPTPAPRRGEAAISPDGRTIAHEVDQAPAALYEAGVSTPVPGLRRPLGFSSSGRHVYGFAAGPEPRMVSFNRDTRELHELGRSVLALAPDDHALTVEFDAFMGNAVLALRSLATGEARWTVRFERSTSLGEWGDHAEFAAQIDPQGVGLAIRAGDQWLLGELTTGRLTRSLDIGPHLRGAWLPGGDFAVAHNAEIWTWDRPTPTSHAGDRRLAAVSPTGARALAYDRAGERAVVLDMSSGTSEPAPCVAEVSHDLLTYSRSRHAIDDRGRVFHSGEDLRACVGRPGQPPAKFALPDYPTALALGDGDQLFIGLRDGGLLTWDRPGDPPRRLELGAEVVNITPLHASGQIAVTRAGVFAVPRVGDVQDIVRVAADHPRAARMATTVVVAHPRLPIAAVLLPGDDALHIHDLAAGTTRQRTLTLAAPAAAYSPSGDLLAVAAADRRLQIFTDADEPGRTLTLPEEVESLTFLGEDQLAVVGDSGALLRVDIPSGESAVLQREYTRSDDFYSVTLLARASAPLLGYVQTSGELLEQPSDLAPRDRDALSAWLLGRRSALTGQ